MTGELAVPAGVFRVQRLGQLLAVLGIIGCFLGARQGDQFFRSYLFGFLFWTFLSVGATALLMIQHLTGGMWGVVNRRLLEAASRTFPLLALLFVPVALGVGSIYPWARPEALADPILLLKAPYLNVPFFLGRAVFFFAVWAILAAFLNRWSLSMDAAGADEGLATRLENLSGAGLVILALTTTFASIDWAMSLSPHWFSTIYGFLFMVGGILSAWSFVIVLVAFWGGEKPLDRVATPTFVHDMGKFLLAFVMLWAYVNLSQFLIIWSGNLPEEIPWYRTRLAPPWGLMGQALLIFHFAVPFLVLLSRDLKRARRRLGVVAGLVFFMRIVDLSWVVGPELHPSTSVHLLDLASWAAVGGIWLWFFVRELKKRPMLPVGEPQIRELLERAS